MQDQLGGDLAYTTVMTILTRLQAKRAVTRERVGRFFEWCATSDEAGLAALRMRRVLDAESDREAVLARFVTTLSPDDERLLRDLLNLPEEGRRADGMGVFVLLPLLLPLSALPIARLAERHLHPRVATRLLSALAAVLALCSTVCLGLLVVVGTVQLPGHPLPDAWADAWAEEDGPPTAPYEEAAGKGRLSPCSPSPCRGRPPPAGTGVSAAGRSARWPGCRTANSPY